MDAITKKVLNKYRGSFLGCAIGDATGFIAEKQKPHWCAAYFADWEKDELDARTRGVFSFGQYSDDTQQTAQLAESLLACNGFSGEHFAGLLKASFLGGTMVGAGQDTKQACLNMVNGLPWDDAGVPAPGAGNGPAMRVAPIALWYNDTPTGIINHAREQAYVTHQNPICGDMAAILALTHYFVMPVAENLDTIGLLDRVQQTVLSYDMLCRDPIGDNQLRPFTEESLHALHILQKLARKNPEYDLEKAADYVAHNLDSYRNPDDWHYISPFIVPTVIWSIYAFIRNPESFTEALRWAICCGGDVDTTGAITGMLSGAYLGRNQLPNRMIQRVNDRGGKKADYLTNLADQIFERRF